MHFRIDFDIDDQAPALPRISAYRRCKQMNPRWREDLQPGHPGGALPLRGQHKPGERLTQQRHAPAFH